MFNNGYCPLQLQWSSVPMHLFTEEGGEFSHGHGSSFLGISNNLLSLVRWDPNRAMKFQSPDAVMLLYLYNNELEGKKRHSSFRFIFFFFFSFWTKRTDSLIVRQSWIPVWAQLSYNNLVGPWWASRAGRQVCSPLNSRPKHPSKKILQSTSVGVMHSLVFVLRVLSYWWKTGPVGARCTARMACLVF